MRIRNSFQTLSPNNPSNFDVIEGLFYVPTLGSSYNATCAEAYSLIPPNVTTVASFPRQDYPFIALFPWTNSSDCTEAYLAQARSDAVRGVITYQPDDPDDQPPSRGDNTWLLNGDMSWKQQNQYPIYAINAVAGANFMTQLALYSGNMTSVPNGQALTGQYDSRDFPRLFAQVELQGQSSVPSLWIFLIIVLAVLLGIVILASIVMHIIQRHQRKVLQRRLERGEVDLEMLGIKKMNVPQEKIDEMPKYVFTDAPSAPAAVAVPSSPSKSTKAIPHQPQASFSQTTCPICLDDFVGGETEVRELPCKHIFHPECIDLFLRDNSSLCPMCKKSALPPGYCPIKVTNIMVRRERLVRRMRERRRQGMENVLSRSGGTPATPTTKVQKVTLWLKRKMRVGSGLPTASAPDMEELAERRQRRSVTFSASSPGPADVEAAYPMTNQRQSVSQPLGSGLNSLNVRRQTMAVPPEIAAQGAAARRAWRRERVAQQQNQAYDQQAQTVREVDEGRPLWRRVVGRVAPGLD